MRRWWASETLVRVEATDPAASLGAGRVRAVWTRDPHGRGAHLIRVQVVGNDVTDAPYEVRMVVWSRNAENVFQFQL